MFHPINSNPTWFYNFLKDDNDEKKNEEDDDEIILIKPRNKNKNKTINNFNEKPSWLSIVKKDNKKEKYFSHLNPENLIPTNTLYIEGLYIGTTKEEIKKIIKDNNIVDIRLILSKTLRRQLCFIEFNSIQSASNAMRKYQGYLLCSKRHLRITFSNTSK